MISYIENLSPDEVARLPQNSIKARILAIFSAYGAGFDFLDFWLQKVNEKVTAALCRFSGELWLLAGEDADFEELSAFCGVIAPTVLTDSNTAERLGLQTTSGFYELKTKTDGNKNLPDADVARLYEILCDGFDGDIQIPNREEWYADISHRMRHGAAAAAVFDNAAALAGFVTDGLALVTGVAVRKKARNSGQGRAVLKALCQTLPNSIVYAEAGENTANFYIKCGFEKSGQLVRCKTK